MEKKLKTGLIIGGLIGATLFSAIKTTNAAPLNQRVKGKILLQVESKGEAWYVNPTNNEVVSLGRPDVVLDVIKKSGLGITDADLQKIPLATSSLATSSLATSTDATSTLLIDMAFAKKQAGKILLQVQSLGEAWYVNPDNDERYFLGTAAEALNVMRTLGLGISNADLDKVKNPESIDSTTAQVSTGASTENKTTSKTTAVKWTTAGLKAIGSLASFDYSTVIRNAYMRKVEAYAKRLGVTSITASVVNSMHE